jgi:hypothetical protein
VAIEKASKGRAAARPLFRLIPTSAFLRALYFQVAVDTDCGDEVRVSERWRIRTLPLFAGIAILMAVGAPAQRPAPTIPSGTIIPVRLNSTLSSQKSRARESLSARVMQNVPLPNQRKIREGAKVIGHVIEATPKMRGSAAKISFVFDRVVLGKQSLAVLTNLRALASMVEVDQAQIPPRGMGESDVWASRTTVQVGGDVVYWGGGPVESSTGVVGKPVDGESTTGVLVKLTVKPGSPCHGEIGDHRGPQALWVFSSDACGIYGIPGTTVAHYGRTKPAGVIELASESDNIKVRSGSGLLVRVIESREWAPNLAP